MIGNESTLTIGFDEPVDDAEARARAGRAATVVAREVDGRPAGTASTQKAIAVATIAEDEALHRERLRAMDDPAVEHGQRDAGADDRRWTGREEVAVEHDDVRVHPRRDAAAPVRPRSRPCALPAVYASSASGSDSFSGDQPPAGSPLRRLPVDRRVERDERVVRHDRPVRPERHDAARLADRPPRPGAPRPIGPDVRRPRADLVRRRVAVVRLHRGDHAELPEPRDVGRVDHLDVLDPVAPGVRPGRDAAPMRVTRPRPVRPRRVLVRVERHPDAAVADGVELDLPAPPVGLGDERVELVRLPRGEAGAGVVLVRGEHRGRPRVDDAVHESLEDPGVEERAAAQREGLRLVRVEPVPPLVERLTGLHDQRARGSGAPARPPRGPAPGGELRRLEPGVLRRR